MARQELKHCSIWKEFIPSDSETWVEGDKSGASRLRGRMFVEQK
jgi:hypothetical protein